MRWLTKFFKQKKTLEQIRDWLVEEKKKQNEEQQQATQNLEQEFPELLKTVKQSLTGLEQAELRNPNIPERAKHFMYGNREQFLKLTNRFLENLAVPKSAADFSQQELIFQQYAQNTARPGAILSEFLGEEIKQIRTNVAAVGTKFQELKAVQVKREKLEEIAGILHDMDEVKKEKENVEKQREEFQKQLEQLKNKLEALKKEKEEFTSKPEYVKIKEDIVSAAKERQESEQEITSLFFPLTDAIKKYAHLFKNQKLAKYGENPLEALIHDYSLGILKYVPEIKVAINTGKIALKPEKTQKALEALNDLNKEKLGAMIHRYANAKKRETDVHHDIAQRGVMKEYEQYAHDIKATGNEIEQLENTINKLKPPTDEELVEKLKQTLEEHKIVLV